MSITQLTLGTEISRQAITKHLSVLAGVGLVRDLKWGENGYGNLSRLNWMRRAAYWSSSASNGTTRCPSLNWLWKAIRPEATGPFKYGQTPI